MLRVLILRLDNWDRKDVAMELGGKFSSLLQGSRWNFIFSLERGQCLQG